MITPNCSICSNTKSLKSICETDGNGVKLSTKLEYIAPEVVWLDNFRICDSCTESLIIACNFRESCLNVQRNDLKIEKYPESFNSCEDIKDFDYENDLCDENAEKCQNETEASTQNELFTCYKCEISYRTKTELIKHIEDEHGKINKLKVTYKRKKPCTKCGRKYVLASSLEEHLLECDGIVRHGKVKSEYQCYKCGKYYTTKKILNSHQKRCEKEDVKKTNYHCSTCNTYYISAKTLRSHKKRGCNKDKPDYYIYCKICSEHFQSSLMLKDHCSVEHRLQDIHCDMCSLKFESTEEFDCHNNSEHRQIAKASKRARTARRFTCEICNEQFSLRKAIIEHCVSIHSLKENAVKPYSCQICNNRFKSSANLFNHMLYHERNRINICSICGKSFITKSDLLAHEFIHKNFRNFKCNKCQKAFKTNTNLRTHCLIVHTDPLLWKYVCRFCDKRFPQKSNHDQHLRRHVGEKNFICELCKKAFASKNEMQEHAGYHSNVRAYKCAHCGKEYRKKHTYNQHLAKIHSIGNTKIQIRERKHACHICPGRFHDRLKLARHLCTHSGEKPFACHNCEKKFTDKSYLKQHLKTAHNIIENPSNELSIFN